MQTVGGFNADIQKQLNDYSKLVPRTPPNTWNVDLNTTPYTLTTSHSGPAVSYNANAVLSPTGGDIMSLTGGTEK